MDKLSQLRLFCRLAERGSFSAVARDSGTTQPVVSKAISALERVLGVRLVNRSTRAVSLTEAGRSYYERCRQILADLDEADASLGHLRSDVSGTLRVTAPVPFGLMFISPRTARFKAMYPALSLDLDLSDQPLNLIEHNIDVAIRLGHMCTPGMAARKLGTSPFLCVAAPAYLAQWGIPTSPEALTSHNCIVYSNLEQPQTWGFAAGGGKVTVAGNYRSNNLLAIRDAVVAGIGIARLPLWMVDSQLRAGLLKAILTDDLVPSFDIHAIFPSGRKNPMKTRLFVDFLQQELHSVSYFLGVEPSRKSRP
jgi:DNA-binding transcriptional LysR family regulator